MSSSGRDRYFCMGIKAVIVQLVMTYFRVQCGQGFSSHEMCIPDCAHARGSGPRFALDLYIILVGVNDALLHCCHCY